MARFLLKQLCWKCLQASSDSHRLQHCYQVRTKQDNTFEILLQGGR